MGVDRGIGVVEVIKMKAGMTCLEGKVGLVVGVDRGIAVGEVIKMKAEIACLEGIVRRGKGER